jgi:transposase/ribosomal protein L34
MSAVKPRLLYAERRQMAFRDDSLDQLLPPEHPVRAVWSFVESLDLSDLLAKIKSTPGRAGAPALDPRVLLAVTMYGVIQGVGSARRLEALCVEHLAYRWLCGGLEPGYHTLSDFRTRHDDVLTRLLRDAVAAMMHEGLVTLDRVAQDGMRVRASAGASSFRRKASLAACREEAAAQVETLKSQVDEDQGAAGRRAAAAKERAAADRLARLEGAQREWAKMQGINAARPPSLRKKEEALRASMTDPECRKMKMADGGFRPAYNVQFATDAASGVIVGVDVVNDGADATLMPPMVERIDAGLGARPKAMLVDGGFAALEAIDEAERRGVRVYAPVRDAEKREKAGEDPYARQKRDTDRTAGWRERMKTVEAKKIYKERASTAEWSNAQARNRGLYAFRVRGLAKALTIAKWHVLIHNFQRLETLRQPRRDPLDPRRTVAKRR